MPYIRKPRRLALRGFGDFNDESPCASIPAGDPYRKPGNYCATPDGGYTTFNADGSTYVDPSAGGTSTSDKIGRVIAFLGSLMPKPVVATVPVAPPGMSTTTKIALAGGALLVVALIARRQ